MLFIVCLCLLQLSFNTGYILTTQRALEYSFLRPNKDQMNQDLWDWTWELALLQSSQMILMYPQC